MAKNDDVIIEADQVWLDKQIGQDGRSIVVLDTERFGTERVRIETLTAVNNAIKPEAAVGRRSTMAVATLRKNFELDVAATERRKASVQRSDSSGDHSEAADVLRSGLAAGDLLNALNKHMVEGDPAVITTSCRRGRWTATIQVGTRKALSAQGDDLVTALGNVAAEAGWF